MRSILLSCFACLLVGSVARGQATPKNQPAAEGGAGGAAGESKFSLTIYSAADPAIFEPREEGGVPGYGVVREIRKINLSRSDGTVKFADVAARIDPTTVSFKSLTAPDTTAVLEQNYEYDLYDADRLLSKYVGKNVILNRKQEPLAGDRTRMPETIEAKLLAFTKEQIVLQTNNKQLPIQIIPRNADIAEIKLFDLQTGLTTQPTLVWRVSAQQAGDHEVLVSYQTDALAWRADYNLLVGADETKADLSAWVTVVNESGASYPNARLKLVAGDVQRLATMRAREGRGFFGAQSKRDAFAEREFFEYHLYALGRATSLPDKSVKQIELFPARGNVPVAKTLVYEGAPVRWPIPTDQPNIERGLNVPRNAKVDVYLKLANTEQNGLGLPLPAGRVRVYKRDEADRDDPAGVMEFVGEDAIGHTPRGEQVLMRMGSAFDVVGERAETNFTVDAPSRTMTESFTIKLRNHKKQPVSVIVKEQLYRWGTWEIAKSSDKFEKKDARTIHIPVEVGADQEEVVTYTVKYTW